MIEVTVAFAACSRTKAATIKTTARLRSARWSSSAGLAEPSWSGAVDRWEIMTAAVAMVSTAIAPMARRMARLPKAPMISVASGGQAIQATETMARVLTMSAGVAPECRRWANSNVLPTPAGPPTTTRATTATGSSREGQHERGDQREHPARQHGS
jgi:hypothetical protein